VKRFALAAAILLLAACGGDRQSADGRRSGRVDLTGAGATFPYPIYSRWMSDYDRDKGVRINYQSIGSGGGIRQLSENTVDFGASDSPMTDEEISRARGPVLHIPTVIGSVVLAYNLPQVQDTLQLAGDVIADIFLGRITRWNDARIAALNPGISLPNQNIVVVHRSDGSGTTFVITDYLASVSDAWATGPGRAKEVRWPVGLGGKGNEGVAGQVRQTPGSIGYIEAAYARQNRLTYARVRNAAGNFTHPTEAAVTEAAASVLGQMGEGTDFRVSIVNPPGEGAYPIASFTWILLYRSQPNAEKGQKLIDFLRWVVTDGQRQAAALDYAPLPQLVVDQIQQQLSEVRIGAPAAT
jgi:phosphate transport system substrate-binding protein